MLNVVVLTTGPLLTLVEARRHLRVDTDDEDTLIDAYTDAAVQQCLTYCDLKLVPVGAEPSFKAAAMLRLGDLYSSREAVISGGSFSVSPTIGALLDPFRLIRI